MACAEWHVAVLRWDRWQHAAEALQALACVAEVCAPTRVEIATLRGRSVERRVPWLGPLALARWPTDDPHAWHDVASLIPVLGIVGGWPPAVVPREQVTRLLRSIEEKQNKPAEPTEPPCKRDELVRFTHLAFFRLIARCAWVSHKHEQVGLRLMLLGREVVLPVPWSAVERREQIDAPQLGKRRRRRYGKIVADV